MTTTIAKCRSKEAAKRHQSDITTSESEVVAALHRPYQPTQNALPKCPGCGSAAHRGGRRQCPAYNQTCTHCHKVGHFARVCRSKQAYQQAENPQHQPGAKAIRVQSHQLSQQQYLQLYKVQETTMEPAPTITVQISSSTGTRYLEVLPDSGADISAAGQEVLELLGQHIDNILPSGINPRTVNGTSMIPLGKVPVTIKLGKTTYKDDLHIYPGVSGVLISWKAAKGLGILSASYPYPQNQPDKDEQLNQKSYLRDVQLGQVGCSPTAEDLVKQFPTVFDGQIRTMEGEIFHISLVEDAVPFCVKTPRSIPKQRKFNLQIFVGLQQLPAESSVVFTEHVFRE